MIYLNEFDTHAAEWLRELSRERLIPEAFVDDRSIKEVKAKDLEGYDQCHFFAGISGWSEALRLSGWPESLRLWTGSCPCQPFSSAGKGLGTDDPRHLWPDFLRLIAQCRPPVVFGEQVASAAGREWLAGVRVDLEALGYAVGCADLCAAGVGAPHLRQRLYWVAYAESERESAIAGRTREGIFQRDGCGPDGGMAHAQRNGQERVIVARDHDLDGEAAGRIEAAGRSSVRGRADAVGQPNGTRWHQGELSSEADGHWSPARPDGCPVPVGDTNLPGCGEQRRPLAVQPQQSAAELRGDPDALGHATGRGQPVGGDASQPWGGRHAFGSGWSRFDVILCRDGKHRRIPAGAQPLVQPVVDGVPVSVDELWGSGSPVDRFEEGYPLTLRMPGRVGLLRGAGNAIVPAVAAVFIRAFMESVGIVPQGVNE